MCWEFYLLSWILRSGLQKWSRVHHRVLGFSFRARTCLKERGKKRLSDALRICYWGRWNNMRAINRGLDGNFFPVGSHFHEPGYFLRWPLGQTTRNQKPKDKECFLLVMTAAPWPAGRITWMGNVDWQRQLPMWWRLEETRLISAGVNGDVPLQGGQ